MEVDYQGNKNILDLAMQAAVKKFIFVSVHNADRIENLATVRELFVADLKDSRLDYTVIRPTSYFSDMSEYLKMADSGRVYLIGDGQHKINPIHGADLARVCVETVESRRKEIPIGGPETFTYANIAELAFSVLDKAPKITHIPLGLVRIVVKLLRPFNNKYYTLASFFAAVMQNNFEAPKTGTHLLKEYYLPEIFVSIISFGVTMIEVEGGIRL